MVIQLILKDGKTLTEEGLADTPIEAGLLGAIVDEMLFMEREFYKPFPEDSERLTSDKN